MENINIKCPKNKKIKVENIQYSFPKEDSVVNSIKSSCNDQQSCDLSLPGFDIGVSYACIEDIGSDLLSEEEPGDVASTPELEEAINRSKSCQKNRMATTTSRLQKRLHTMDKLIDVSDEECLDNLPNDNQTVDSEEGELELEELEDLKDVEDVEETEELTNADLNILINNEEMCQSNNGYYKRLFMGMLGLIVLGLIIYFIYRYAF